MYSEGEGYQLRRGKWFGIIGVINKNRGKDGDINLKLSKDDILAICGIKEGDKEYNYGLSYMASLIRSMVKNYDRDIKFSVRRNEGVIRINKEKIVDKTTEKKIEFKIETSNKKEEIDYGKIFNF